MEQAVLDDIINRLLEVRGRPGKQVQLSESEIKQLCTASREIFLQQPNLLELEAPIKICGNFLLTFLPLLIFLILGVVVLLFVRSVIEFAWQLVFAFGVCLVMIWVAFLVSLRV